MAVITVRKLSKKFNIYKRNTQKIKCIILGSDSNITKRALKDVSFDIDKGERVAIIGRNGSGRTTLLRIIAGIYYPSSGKVSVKGIVNPMLYPQSGIDRGFNARDNIRIKGSIMGWSKKQIEENMDSILAFADAEDFDEMPLKTYPPTLAGRIGFAMYMTYPGDILLMDDRFAVGNKGHRKKCFAKLEEVLQDPEMTFLMVTKNFMLAKRFCTRGLVLDKGELVFDGDLSEAIKYYRQNCAPVYNNQENDDEEDDENTDDEMIDDFTM